MYLLTSPFIITLEINLLLKSFSKFCPFPSIICREKSPGTEAAARGSVKNDILPASFFIVKTLDFSFCLSS